MSSPPRHTVMLSESCLGDPRGGRRGRKSRAAWQLAEFEYQNGLLSCIDRTT